MFHKLRAVQPLPDYCLLATFQDGSARKYDVKALLEKWPAFASLRDTPGLFQRVRVDAGGYGVSWNDEIDLSCEELWERGIPVESRTA